MGQVKRLIDVIETLKLAYKSAAICADLDGMRSFKVILDGIRDGNKESIDRGFKVHTTLMQLRG